MRRNKDKRKSRRKSMQLEKQRKYKRPPDTWKTRKSTVI